MHFSKATDCEKHRRRSLLGLRPSGSEIRGQCAHSLKDTEQLELRHNLQMIVWFTDHRVKVIINQYCSLTIMSTVIVNFLKIVIFSFFSVPCEKVK